jgi:hypothetical protein
MSAMQELLYNSVKPIYFVCVCVYTEAYIVKQTLITEKWQS